MTMKIVKSKEEFIAIASEAIFDDVRAQLHDLDDQHKLYRCHTIGNCTSVCPKHLQPSVAITKIKQLIEKE